MNTNGRFQPRRILVIDDEAKFSCLVAGFLMGRGYQTNVASNGDEALEALKHFSPEIVLLDVHMPGLSGLELLKRIRSTPLPPRVIMVTAMDTSDMIDEAMDNGAEGYLCKPIDLNHLAQLIAEL
jgi:DNA-binding response OmpR family regulator